MTGQNKWSKIKRLQAVTAARRGRIFSRLAREITLAAKNGGGILDANARLRTLVLKAREANMPADNVDRAVKQGTGELPGVAYEEITYIPTITVPVRDAAHAQAFEKLHDALDEFEAVQQIFSNEEAAA